jgi:beta-glucosidase
MKRVFGIWVAALLVLTGITAFGAQKDTLRILAIGNSFSWNAVEQNLSAIALADGKCAIIGNMYIGGCSLERHWNNAQTDNTDYSYRKINQYDVKTTKGKVTLAEALADEPWDIVTFQQASHFSGFPDTYEPYLTELIKYVKARVPAATKLYWHQTWAYATTSNHRAFPDYDKDQGKMYAMIMAASSKACKSHRLTVIPCGTTMQNLRGTFVGDNVTTDGFHLNNLGKYAAACTWYQVLFGESVVGNAFRPQYLTEEEVEAAQLSAAAAVKKPFKVSKVQ